MIFGVDPGTTESGWCQFDGKRVVQCGVFPNELMREWISESGAQFLAIEMVDSYGMPVGKEVFQTVLWTGRFQQSWRDPNAVRLIYRRDVTKYLLPPPKKQYKFATADANIRAALISRLGEDGTVRAGVKSHAWAALAVAVTALETK